MLLRHVLSCTAVVMMRYAVSAIPVDNGVEGEPEIECGPTSIAINFNTRNTFEGHVYVKGLYNQPGCRNDDNGRQVAGISLPFDSCNVARTRSLNPRGIFVSTTIVVSFHPQFVTKVDRAYRIQCFYMEADKTVSQDIAVSDLTTSLETVIVPMPICRYDILEGGPNGAPINFALVGEQVYHKWTCETETTDTFCMVVHSCTIDDGNGDTIQIIDENGCARDRFLLNNLEYPTDLMAGQEAHVYKYADRDGLFYQCQISITIKEPNSECPRPSCEEPAGFGAISAAGALTGFVAETPAPAEEEEPVRRRRLQKREAGPGESILDVRAELNAFDISDDSTLRALLRHDGSLERVPMTSSTNERNSPVNHSFASSSFSDSSRDVCVTSFTYFMLLVAAFLCSSFIVVVGFSSLRSSHSGKASLYE